MAKIGGKLGSIYDLGIPVWSPNRLGYLAQCPRKFYFAYVAKVKVPVGPMAALGIFLHLRAEKFFKDDGTPKFKTPDSFANAAGNYWSHAVKKGNVGGRDIRWGDRSPHAMKEYAVKPICRRMYAILAEEGPPLLSEYKFSILLDGRAITGVVDSVRVDENGFKVIRDYKSGAYSRNPMAMIRQFTWYAVAYSATCNADPAFREKMGVSDEEARNYVTREKDEAGKTRLRVHFPKDLRFEIMRLHSDDPEGLAFWRARSIEKRLKELGLKDLAKKQSEIIKGLEARLGEVDAEEPVTFIPIDIKQHYYDDFCEQIDTFTMMEYLMREKEIFPVEKSKMCPYCDFAKHCDDYHEKYGGKPKQMENQFRLFDGFKPVPRVNADLLIFPASRHRKRKDPDQMSLIPKKKRKAKKKKAKKGKDDGGGAGGSGESPDGGSDTSTPDPQELGQLVLNLEQGWKNQENS